MDPASILSIVNGCVGLAMKCGMIAADLHNLASKYKQAKLSVMALSNECHTLELVLDRIEFWARSSTEGSHLDNAVLEQLNSSLGLGAMVVSSLEEQLMLFKDIKQSSGFRRRAKIVWNDGVLKEHEDRIRGQLTALSCLLHVISL
jgi:hypothetical protein